MRGWVALGGSLADLRITSTIIVEEHTFVEKGSSPTSGDTLATSCARINGACVKFVCG